MFCTKCGKKLEEKALFCSNCGTKVENNNKENSTRNIYIIVGIFVIIVLLIWCVRGTKKNDNKVTELQETNVKETNTEDILIMEEEFTTEEFVVESSSEEQEKIDQDEIIAAYEQYLYNELNWVLAENPYYYLIYLNNDKIPELIVDTYTTAGGTIFLSYDNGAVCYEHLSSGVLGYAEYGNILHLNYGRMGGYGDIIYTLEDNKLVIKAQGTYSEMYYDETDEWVTTYYWEDVEISSQEYQNRINQAKDNMWTLNTYEMSQVKSLQEAYTLLKKTSQKYSEDGYLISRFEMIDGYLYVQTEGKFNNSGIQSIKLKVLPNCDWYRYYTSGERGDTVSYEIIKAEIDSTHAHYAADRANYVIESPTGYVIEVLNEEVVAVYSVNS